MIEYEDCYLLFTCYIPHSVSFFYIMLPNLPFFLTQKLSQKCHYKCQLGAIGSMHPDTGRYESLAYKEHVQKFYQSLFHPNSADGFPTISQWPLKLRWGRSPGFAHKSGQYIFIVKKDYPVSSQVMRKTRLY